MNIFEILTILLISFALSSSAPMKTLICKWSEVSSKLETLNLVCFSFNTFKDGDEDPFEGDIVLTEAQSSALSRGGVGALLNTFRRWPNKMVPYEFSRGHSEVQIDMILASLKKIESVTCIRFVPRTNERAYVQIRVSYLINFKFTTIAFKSSTWFS